MTSKDWSKMSDKDWQKIEEQWETPEEKEEYEYKPPDPGPVSEPAAQRRRAERRARPCRRDST